MWKISAKHLLSVLLFALISFAVFTRFLWLDKFPAGMYHDEIEYLFSAKSYATMGTDLSGYGFPLSLFKTETDGIISPVAPILIAPLTLFISLNQESARFPFVVLNILTAVIAGLICFNFSRRKVAGVLGFAVFLINPWSFYLSRYAADTPFALFFYLCGIYLMQKMQGWKLLIPILFFILGFFSYHGAKMLFLPLIGILLIYRLSGERNRLKVREAVSVMVVSALFFGAYLTVSYFIPGSIITARSDDLILNRQDQIVRTVDEKRRLMLDIPAANIFVNKLTVITGFVFEKYLNAFSPQVMFISGDNRATYRFSDHGLFYPFDLIFILLGVFCFYRTNKKSLGLLFSILLISPLSTSISAVETSVIHRSFLMLPILTIFITFGLLELLHLVDKKWLKTVLAISSFTVFFFVFANFLLFYFFRYPVFSQESYFLSERLLSKFMTLDQNSKFEVVLSEDKLARSVFLEVMFYSGGSKNGMEGILHNLKSKNYVAGNFQFTGTCPETIEANKTYIFSRDTSFCGNKPDPDYKISDQKDGGGIFQIYNSGLCDEEELALYKRTSGLDDFSIEKLDQREFCRRWINKP